MYIPLRGKLETSTTKEEGMDFSIKLDALSSKIADQIERIETEEATKNAFVMPFIQALGYDVFDPTEVVPEYTADVGKKKGEKVDYAIIAEGEPTILFECKTCSAELTDAHAAQLRRYFHVTTARIGILTNGISYMFFSDLDKENIMDDSPFMHINLLDIDDQLIQELKKLTKISFEIDSMLSTANNLKYTREIKICIEEELENPSPEFVKLIIGKFYDSIKTQQVIEHFTPLVKKSFQSLVTDHISNRLKSAFSEQQEVEQEIESPEDVDENDNGIVTTEEELEGFMVIKAILRETIDISRISPRDTKSYFGVLLDNNNRKPICRLHFNAGQKYIGILDQDKKETREPIESLDDIYNFTNQIRAAVGFYE